MKYSIYLLVFLPLISLAQSFVGQPIFTEAQRQEMKIRFADGPYKSRVTGSFGAYDGTFDKIVQEKNDFMANPDAGDWDFAVEGNDELNKLPGQDTSNPTPQANGNIEDLHSAAIWAFTFYDDPNPAIAAEAAAVGAEVCKEIYDRSIDPKLDTSNRTRYNPDSFATNPYLFYVGKFTKYLNDYALLRSAGIDGLSSSQRITIDNWLKDADAFWGEKIDTDTKSRFGNNWKNEVYGSSSWNNAIRDGSSRTNPIFTNSSGTPNSNYIVSEKMSGFWNIGYDYMMFRALYGIIFNNQNSKDHSWAYYRDTFKFAVFSDGTFAEMIRATSSKEDWGVFYGTVTFGAMVKMALWHAIGVENSLTGMGDKGKYFDYSTSLGIDSYASLNGHGGSSTSGGNKSLLLVGQAWAKFYEQSNGSSFGWQPQRYNDVSSGVNLIEGSNHFHFISPAAAMNAWYNDPEIKNWYKGLGNYPPIKDKSSGAQSIAGSWAAGQGNANEYHGVGLWYDMEDIMFSGSTENSNQCPRIESIAGNILELSLNDIYTEQGGTWTDREDGTGDATVGGDLVDTSSAGAYIVTYSYTDNNGCLGSTTLSVIIKDPNNDCPVVTSNAGNSLIIDINVGDNYTEQGGTWTDTEDGSGTASIGGDTVNIGAEETYVVTYSYTDNNDCTTTTSLTVNVQAISGEILMEFVDLTNSTASVGIGSIVSPAYTSGPFNADIPYVWMYSSDPTIIERQSNGVSFLGLKEGVVTITLATADGTPHTDTLVLTVTTVDEGGISFPNITASDAVAEEGEPLNFVFTLSEPSTEKIDLTISYNNQTTSNEDYIKDSYQISFAPGETEKIIVVETIDDTFEEEDETFSIKTTIDQPGQLANNVDEVIGTILNNDILEDLKIYPNPTSSGSQINISGLEEGTYQMVLYDLSGRLLQNSIIDFDGSSVEYTLPGVRQGFYILNIDGFEGKHSGKIIIQ